MAAEERRVKGSLGRKPFLVLPPPKKSDENGGEDKPRNGNEDPAQSVSSEEENGTTAGSEASGIEAGEGPPGSEVPGDKTSVDGHSSSSCGDDLLDIYVGSGTDQAIFQLIRKAASKSAVLLHHLREGNPSFVMHPDLYRMPASAFEPIHSFLATSDYGPKLIVVNEKIKAGEDHSILGDQFSFGLKYELERISSAAELHEQILRLGRIYISAKVFELTTMQVLTLWKLQAAWNSYSGIPQLMYFLQTVQFVFEKTKRCPDSLVQGTSREPMQRWAAGFLVDLMDLFFRAYPEEFWKVLKGNPALQAAVFERRATSLAKHSTVGYTFSSCKS
ncbi:hypothetical protein VTN77DRAFT_8176 [Rasamsonia byssochlamydoides]|uniref:uncharacterized protein n=1 Tax=Rasamsonia byssochlamydoides TaxID=89139 RepID=UPI003742A469